VLLAARNEGLGGVLTSVLMRQEPAVRELLGIPEGFAVAGLMALGHPQKVITKLRRDPVERFTRSTGSTGRRSAADPRPEQPLAAPEAGVPRPVAPIVGPDQLQRAYLAPYRATAVSRCASGCGTPTISHQRPADQRYPFAGYRRLGVQRGAPRCRSAPGRTRPAAFR